MTKFYVILSEGDYEEGSSKIVIAWTSNPFIAISYYKEYKLLDDDVEMVIYECESNAIFCQILSDDLSTDLYTVLQRKLITQTSKDGKCYAIFTESQIHFFTDKFINENAAYICNELSSVMLASAPLTKYIRKMNDSDNKLLSLLFTVYAYTSVKQSIREKRQFAEVSSFIDIVYFWKMYTSKGSHITSNFNTTDIFSRYPDTAVFVDY